MYMFTYHGAIHIKQVTQSAQVLVNAWMNKENVVYINNEVLFSNKRGIKIMSMSGKWMELKIIILSEIIQAQKDKYVVCHTLDIDFFAK